MNVVCKRTINADNSGIALVSDRSILWRPLTDKSESLAGVNVLFPTGIFTHFSVIREKQSLSCIRKRCLISDTLWWLQPLSIGLSVLAYICYSISYINGKGKENGAHVHPFPVPSTRRRQRAVGKDRSVIPQMTAWNVSAHPCNMCSNCPDTSVADVPSLF